jgi:hypothetical protein
VLLRDPVDRARSAFLHAQRLGAVSGRETFEDAYFGEARRRVVGSRWGRIRWDGMYGHHLTRYLDQFEREQLHVEFFEDFIRDPVSALHRIWDFLGVTGVEVERLPHANKARGSRAPRLTGVLNRSRRALLVRGHRRTARRLRYLEWLVARPTPRFELSSQSEERMMVDYAPDVIALTDLVGRRPPWPRFQALVPEHFG